MPRSRSLHRSENDLAGALLNVSDQQKVDHEIFYVARDIAGWSQEHVRRLAEVGADYGLELDPDPEDEATLLAKIKQKGSGLTGRFHEPALLLLADLRHIHRTAAGVSLDWEVLAQTAQAMQDSESALPDPRLPPTDAAPNAVGQRQGQGNRRPNHGHRLKGH
ncbi:hypothetical protein [Nocardioides convexus]|uniref:hypothetical protein n=1 Tax=Nocardioides convexus TaxID=2712224 RepID=UPI002418B433|nr:hypothetical protein [Nocardioides convexus]